MKSYLSRQPEEAFTILRSNLTHLNLPPELVDELIEQHIAIVFEKGALAFCEGNADGMLALILSGYVNVYCPVGDGNRTLVRMAGPGEIIGYADYGDKRGRHARLFEAQVASRCTLALFSRDHIARLLRGSSTDVLISITPFGGLKQALPEDPRRSYRHRAPRVTASRTPLAVPDKRHIEP